MIWDRVAPLYDVVVNTANRAVYAATGAAVARLIRPGAAFSGVAFPVS